MMIIEKNLFVADINDENSVSIQRWTGSLLNDLIFAKSFNDLLNYKQKIIILNPKEANTQFDVTKKLVDNKNYLIFLQPWESISTDFWYNDLSRDLPVIKQFPRITSDVNDREPFFSSPRDKNWKKNFNLDFFYFATLTDPNILQATNYTILPYLSKKIKPYKFLFLNGKPRDHRKLLWKLLDQNSLLEESLKSYLWFNSESDKTKLVTENSIPLTLLPPEYESPFLDISKIPKYNNDDRNWRVIKKEYWQSQPIEYHIIPKQYIDTYFTVVTETDVESTFVTEKTFKPILAGHPFLILGSPRIYEYLHKLGFKTFDGIIDEKFAFEPDLQTRAEMLALEVKKLCESNLIEFLEKTKSICHYNQRHYINNRQKFFLQKHLELEEFFKFVIDDAFSYFLE